MKEQVYVLSGPSADVQQLNNLFDQFDPGFKKSHWAIDFPNNVKLFVQNDVPKNVAVRRGNELYKEHSLPREAEVDSARLTALKTLSQIAAIPPLVLLALGSAFAWSLSGFKSDKNR